MPTLSLRRVYGVRQSRAMLRDLTSQKKIDPQVIVAAIESLKAKGWDINPNTVADEAKVARSAVYRNPELLELVNLARAGKELTPADEASRVSELEQRNAELEEMVTALELENEKLARSQQNAWQEGYDAGLKEGRVQATEESNRAGTSPQFYESPQGLATEGLDGGREPEREDRQDKSEVAAGAQIDLGPVTDGAQMDLGPVTDGAQIDLGTVTDGAQIDLGPVADAAEFVNMDWLEQQQTDIQDESAAPESLAGSASSGVDSADQTYSRPDDSGLEEGQQYSAEPAYAEEQLLDESVSPTSDAAYSYGYPGEQSDGYGFSDGDWQSGVEDTGSQYAAEDEAPYAGESEESSDSTSQSQTVPISEDELRDLLKFRFGRTSQESIAETEQEKKLAGTKFVGGARPTQEVPKRDFVVRQVPPDIRKACLVLGLRPEDLTREIVHKAWKKEIANPGTHPDVGGDTEIAVYINTAKDTLMRWLDSQAPKLGKQFGKSGREPAKADEKPNPQKSDEHGGQPDVQ